MNQRDEYLKRIEQAYEPELLEWAKDVFELVSPDQMQIVFWSIIDDQDALDSCRWVALEPLLKRGILAEVWPPYLSRSKSSIKPNTQNNFAGTKQSTNRI